MVNYAIFKNQWKQVSEVYPWRFMGFLVLSMLVPKIYELSNVFWIGKISYDALAISEQYEFLAVFIEIINDTIPFGILALVAQNYKNREKIISILKAGLIIHLSFSFLLTATFLFFTEEFVAGIGTPVEIVELTKQYLLLKAFALPFDAMSVLLLITIKAMQKGKEALYLVCASVIINVFLDLLLISNADFSLNLGIKGAAIGYVVSKITLMLISLIFLGKLLKVDGSSFFLANWKEHVKPLFSIGGWTGIDSLVRNAGYMGLLLLLNVIGINEFGGYGLAMTVMWTVIIPVLALGEGTSVAIGNAYGEGDFQKIEYILLISLLLCLTLMGVIVILGIFFWENLSAFFNPNPEMVYYSTQFFWWLIIPYCAFAVGNTIRSVFYGTGQTRYILYLSLISNFLIIFPFVTLIKLNVIVATYTNVMQLFVLVFMIDPVLSYIFLKKVIKKSKTDRAYRAGEMILVSES